MLTTMIRLSTQNSLSTTNLNENYRNIDHKMIEIALFNHDTR